MSVPDRSDLKRAIILRLDAVAEEHHNGHQDVKANRYKMRSDDGALIELMFEKEATQPANLWVLAEHAAPLLDGSIKYDLSPKDKLYKVPAKGGGMQYGRHSALLDMTFLKRADLVCFDLKNMAELEKVLAVLLKLKCKGNSA